MITCIQQIFDAQCTEAVSNIENIIRCGLHGILNRQEGSTGRNRNTIHSATTNWSPQVNCDQIHQKNTFHAAETSSKIWIRGTKMITCVI